MPVFLLFAIMILINSYLSGIVYQSMISATSIFTPFNIIVLALQLILPELMLFYFCLLSIRLSKRVYDAISLGWEDL